MPVGMFVYDGIGRWYVFSVVGWRARQSSACYSSAGSTVYKRRIMARPWHCNHTTCCEIWHMVDDGDVPASPPALEDSSVALECGCGGSVAPSSVSSLNADDMSYSSSDLKWMP